MRALVLATVLVAASASAQAPDITVSIGELSATLDVGESTSRAVLVDNGGDAPLSYRVRTFTSESVSALFANASPSEYGSNGTVQRVDPSTGAVLSSFPSPEWRARLAYDGGTLYALYGSLLRLINPTTGEIVSSVTLADPSGYYDMFDVAVADGQLVVLANTYGDGVVLDLFDTATGARSRRIPLGFGARALAAGDGVYYVSGYDNEAGQVLVTVDAITGERLRTQAFADVSSLTYSRSLGTLLAQQSGYNTSRTVRVYDAETGDFLSSFSLPNTGRNGYSTSYGGLAADEGTEAAWLSVSPRNGTIAAGGQAGLTLTIDAGRVVGGSYTAEMIIASNDPDEPELSLPVSLEAVGVAKIAVGASAIDLGTVYVGTPVTASIAVYNPGSDTLMVNSVEPSDDRLTVSVDTFEVLPGDSTAVEVTVTPTGSGELDATVTLATNVEGQESVVVQVAGTDVFPSVLEVPPVLAIEGIAGEATSVTLTVNNTGQGPLEFEVFAGFQAEVRAARADPARLSSARHTGTEGEGDRLQARRAEARQSRALPSGVEAPTLVLLAADDDSEVFDARALRGGIDGDSLYIAFDFDTLPVDAFMNVFLDLDTDPNTGNQIERLGAEAEIYASFFEGGQYGEVNVYTGYRSTYSSDSWEIDGSTFLLAIPLSALPDLGEAFDAFAVADGTVIRDGSYYSSYDEIPNSGIIAVKAVSAGWLSVSPEAGTVAPGASQEVTVTADAEALVGGEYESVILVEGNGPTLQLETIAVQLDVTGIAAVSADALAFGQVYTGYASTRSLLVTNPGTDRLTVAAITSDDDALVASLDEEIVVGPGASVQVPVSVTATEEGAFSATLTLDTDAPSGPLEVAVTASAVRPPIASLSVERVDLATPIGGITDIPMTLSNEGGVPLTYRAFLIASDGQSAERVDTTVPEAVAADLANVRREAKARTRSRSESSFFPAALDLPTLYADPDEGLAHDVIEVRGAVDDDTGVLQFELVFARAVAPYSLGGAMLFDADQNIQTGQPGLGIGNRQPPLGVEFQVDLNSVRYGEVYVYEWVPPYRSGYVPASVEGSSVRFDVPLGYFGEGAGAFDFASYVFHQSTNGPNTDYVPDEGVASVDARLSWLSVTPRDGTVAAGGSADIMLQVDATNLSFDTYRAQLLLSTNAPGAPSVTVPLAVEVIDNTSAGGETPSAFALAPPAPNPATGTARLVYALAEPAPVTVTVFDTMGRQVLSINAGARSAGEHAVEVDASALSAGVYVVRLQAGAEVASRQLVVAR